MLSAIGGTSASYVRSDMSGDSSVKHKGGIKNNYGETASGSNGVSVPVRTSPNAKHLPLRGRQGRSGGSGVQGWDDGRNHRVWDALVCLENSGEPTSSGVWCFGFGLADGCSCGFQDLWNPHGVCSWWFEQKSQDPSGWRPVGFLCSSLCTEEIAALLLGHGPSYDPRLLVLLLLEHKSDLLEELVCLKSPPDATSMVRAMDMSQESAS